MKNIIVVNNKSCFADWQSKIYISIFALANPRAKNIVIFLKYGKSCSSNLKSRISFCFQETKQKKQFLYFSPKHFSPHYNMDKNKYIKEKKERREKKRTDKRSIQGEEVIFIFEKVLEEWRTIKIFNTIIQQNPSSLVDKKKVETISTGNCKVYPSELSEERYNYYLTLREKVYSYWKKKSPPNVENIEWPNETAR